MKNKNKRYLVDLTVVIVILSFILVTESASAQNLMDAFSQKAFQGSWSFFSKLNFLGYFMQLAISALSLIALCSKSLTIVTTITYLSMKTTFNTVHEIKSAGTGRKVFLGMDAAFGAAMDKGKGIDVAIYMLLSLAPDLKQFSEYNDEYRPKNFKDEDTVPIYVMRSFFPTVFQLLFLSMGFNGSLWKAYANVVDALGVVVDRFIDIELDVYMTRIMYYDGSYPFAYDNFNTNYGSLVQDIANKIYREAAKVMADSGGIDKYAVGLEITNIIDEYFGDVQDPSESDILMAIPNFKGTDDDVKNLKFDKPVVDAKPEYAGAAFTVSMEDLGLEKRDSESPDLYIHIFIHRTKAKNVENYWGTAPGGTSNKKPSSKK